MRSGAFAMGTKGNVVLYLDRELVDKVHRIRLQPQQTFENHLKHLMTELSTGNPANYFESAEKVVGLPGFEPGSIEPKSTSLDQTSRQPRATNLLPETSGRER